MPLIEHGYATGYAFYFLFYNGHILSRPIIDNGNTMINYWLSSESKRVPSTPRSIKRGALPISYQKIDITGKSRVLEYTLNAFALIAAAFSCGPGLIDYFEVVNRRLFSGLNLEPG